MKPPSRAPMYACIYHGLADIARKHGYALAIHGSLDNDLDLIAVPWVADASPHYELLADLHKHCGWCVPEQSPLPTEMEQKPHGRMAWNIYLTAGAKVDVSILPRSNP